MDDFTDLGDRIEIKLPVYELSQVVESINLSLRRAYERLCLESGSRESTTYRAPCGSPVRVRFEAITLNGVPYERMTLFPESNTPEKEVQRVKELLNGKL